MSPQHLLSKHQLDDLGEVFTRTGFLPDALELEVGERLLLEDGGPIVDRLIELRTLGVRIALDHFGAVCAPLKLLERCAFMSTVKLDASPHHR